MALNTKCKAELIKNQQEFGLHMRTCQERSERYKTQKEALRRKISDLTRSSSCARQLSEAAASLNQVHHEVRTLKQTLEHKDRTIDQLRANAKILTKKQTQGSACASPQVDSSDPLTWSLDRQDRVLSLLTLINFNMLYYDRHFL